MFGLNGRVKKVSRNLLSNTKKIYKKTKRMKRFSSYLLILVLLSSISFSSFAQRKKKSETPADSPPALSESVFKAFELRNIGPAFMSGRIADLLIHPEDYSTWYVAVGSGGIWKTENAGISWESVFDGQGSYSIGCLAMDPSNHNTIWAGSGEDAGGRHVAYGDGVYKSEDNGKTWKNMGLKNSEHISKIIVHPENSDIVWVSAQGPLWSPGGDRGIFKTTDGGKSWNKLLGDDEFTGATDLVIDPRDPDILYAATWQHHRTVAAYMGGGPKSALYRSDDGGKNWKKLSNGIPAGNLGKTGLAVSPINPDVVYAALEFNRRKGGVYRSENRGESWQKMSDAVSGGTGPHYYQELYASPHAFDRLYLCDVRIQVSDDGGKTFRQMKEEHKHSDNHSIAFRADDPEYLLIGTDGGIYESFDLAENWRFIENLPITQFYKVAVDDKEPFYTVYGGTQDNNTQGGPSRTDNATGIRNHDWEVVLFADGHQPATEPGNPDIMYAEWQEGNLVRVDRTTGEIVYIQPQPEKGEPAERFNWDSPILVSPHSPTTLLFASQRVWKSEDRGDSWRAISGDLTRNQERIELPIMGRQQSWDSPWDMYAMSTYNTITSLAQSPVNENIIYAGTDDGLLQVTEDGGKSWRKTDLGDLPGVPKMAFVNDVKADLFDESTVYLVADNHKYGDFNPYLLKSTDKGKTWVSLAGDLPERTLLWRIVQDHLNPELLFLGTEFGIYFTLDGGVEWVKITGKAPTISFRDLAIQRRENDLVGASFGRGFFILDDYSPLRELSKEDLEKEAMLFSVRDALWYMPRGVLGRGQRGSQGAEMYIADNPPFGAVFTFYLKDDILTKGEERKKAEKELNKDNKDIPFPGWEALDMEKTEEKASLLLIVKNSKGEIVRKLQAPAKKGFQRIAWDLRYPANRPVTERSSGRRSSGMLVVPGTFTVSLAKRVEGKTEMLAPEVEFQVKPLRKGALEGAGYEETVAFWKETADFSEELSVMEMKLDKAIKTTGLMKISLQRSGAEPDKLYDEIFTLAKKLNESKSQLTGSASKNEVGEKTPHTIGRRMSAVWSGTSMSTYGPTPTHIRSLEIAKEEYEELQTELTPILEQEIPALLKKLEAAGAPWIEGM